MKKHFSSFVKDIIPVIVGILIALFINNWNEDRKERAYLDDILVSINQELEETHQDIDTIMSLQYALIDTLMVYLEDEKTSVQTIMEKANGVSIPTIRIHSWKALSNSRIELLAYEDLSNLASIEEDKTILMEKSKYLMNFLYNNISETKRRSKAMLIGLLNELIGSENSILNEINEMNQRYKSDR